MKRNVIQEKSFRFALRIIKLCRLLREAKEYEMASQIIRCGTSIGANVEEAIGAQGTKDFSLKIHIAHKEARETHYWLRLLKESELIDALLADSLLNDCDELLKISASIIKTVKSQIDNASQKSKKEPKPIPLISNF